MRVLTIASELPPVRSGVARSAHEVVVGLRARGHEVDTISSADAWSKHFGEVRLSALARRWARLGDLCEGYDLVQLHGPAPLISDSLLVRWRASRQPLPPLVYTFHFLLRVDGLPGGPLYDRATRRLLRVPDAVVVTTPSYAEIVEGHAGRVETIPWAGDTSEAAGNVPQRDPHGVLRVLFVGQQRPYKGVPVLIDAVDGLANVALTIIGGGPHLDRYQRSAQSASNVTHLGAVDDQTLDDAMAAADVICLPSTNPSEAFGIVLVEGMAAGCIPVASDLPGVRDVVGSAGLLVAPNDAAALRSALGRLATDPSRRIELAAAARRKAASYSWPTTVDAYEALYLDLVASAT